MHVNDNALVAADNENGSPTDNSVDSEKDEGQIVTDNLASEGVDSAAQKLPRIEEKLVNLYVNI